MGSLIKLGLSWMLSRTLKIDSSLYDLNLVGNVMVKGLEFRISYKGIGEVDDELFTFT